jgi:hypothetical protein
MKLQEHDNFFTTYTYDLSKKKSMLKTDMIKCFCSIKSMSLAKAVFIIIDKNGDISKIVNYYTVCI